MKNFYKKGITAVEALIVIAVLGLMFMIVFPQFAKSRENQVIKAGVQDILSSIDKARVNTLSSLNSSEYGIHFEANAVIIFKGTVFSSGSQDNETVDIISPANISNISLIGGANDFYFHRLTGAPSATGTITISSPSFSKIITISATGIASVN